MSLKWRKSIITISVVLLAVVSYLIYHYGYMVYQTYDYYTHYEDVHGLQRSSHVVLHGVKVGEVSNIEMKNRELVKVTLEIDKDIKLPKGTIALLASKNLMDEKMIVLKTKDNTEYYTHKDFIPGKYDTTVLEMRDQIAPILESTKYTLSSSEKNLKKMKTDIEHGMVTDMQQDVKGFEHKMYNFRERSENIRRSADKISVSLKRLSAQTSEIANNRQSINASIREAETNTKELSEVNFAGQTKEVGDLAITVKEETQKVETSLSETKLVDDNGMYNDAVEILGEANEKAEELKESPPGFSIF